MYTHVIVSYFNDEVDRIPLNGLDLKWGYVDGRFSVYYTKVEEKSSVFTMFFERKVEHKVVVANYPVLAFQKSYYSAKYATIK